MLISLSDLWVSVWMCVYVRVYNLVSDGVKFNSWRRGWISNFVNRATAPDLLGPLMAASSLCDSWFVVI